MTMCGLIERIYGVHEKYQHSLKTSSLVVFYKENSYRCFYPKLKVYFCATVCRKSVLVQNLVLNNALVVVSEIYMHLFVS